MLPASALCGGAWAGARNALGGALELYKSPTVVLCRSRSPYATPLMKPELVAARSKGLVNHSQYTWAQGSALLKRLRPISLCRLLSCKMDRRH